jgi:Pyridine nucleotide-disulphide oxidoreductase
MVSIVHRRPTLGSSIEYWVKPDIENRIAEGSIAARFESRVVEILPDAVIVESHGQRERLPADHVFLMTGYHADFDLLEACGVEVDAATAVPVHDPSTLESNVPNRFLAGGVLAGKDTAPIFIENGRFHGERHPPLAHVRRSDRLSHHLSLAHVPLHLALSTEHLHCKWSVSVLPATLRTSSFPTSRSAPSRARGVRGIRGAPASR